MKHSRYSQAKLAEAREGLLMIHTLADEFAAEVQQLCAITVTNDQWSKFLDVRVPRVNMKGEPLKGRSLTMADNKRDQSSETVPARRGWAEREEH